MHGTDQPGNCVRIGISVPHSLIMPPASNKSVEYKIAIVCKLPFIMSSHLSSLLSFFAYFSFSTPFMSPGHRWCCCIHLIGFLVARTKYHKPLMLLVNGFIVFVLLHTARHVAVRVLRKTWWLADGAVGGTAKRGTGEN